MLCAWGDTVGISKIKTLPIWIKLSNIPDYYWNSECLSRVASVVGPPICADQLTSQLNPLQFAHLCVTYHYGDPLPEVIQVATLDDGPPVQVKISYPNRPLSCSGCKSLGHSIAACPVSKREWVQKTPTTSTLVPSTSSKAEVPTLATFATSLVPPTVEDNVDVHSKNPLTTSDGPLSEDAQEGWTDVKRKHKSPSPSPDFDDNSPSPLNTFKGLRNVDEIDKLQIVLHGNSSGSNNGHLSKSQRKKQKRSGRGELPQKISLIL